jgi:ferric-dicitrate binding protein FerR (iron transport regulator)
VTRVKYSALALGCAMSFVVACDACGDPPLAELESMTGTVTRAEASAPSSWAAAHVEDAFELGDGVRTAARSRAQLLLDDGTRVEVAPSTTLRFRSDRPGARGPGIDLEAGSAVVVTSEDTEIETRGGRTTLRAGTRLELTRSGDDLLLSVSVGRARLEIDGESTELVPGARMEISEGAVRMLPPAPRPVAVAAAPPAPAPTAAAVAPEAAPADPASVEAVLSGGGHQIREGDTEWRDADGTIALRPGVRVRQRSGSTTELRRGADRLTVRGGSELVVGGGTTLATIVSGSPNLESTTGVAIQTPGGVIVLRPGTSAEARISGDTTRVRVRTGAVELGETRRVLSEGESGELTASETLEASTLPSDVGPGLDRTDLRLGAGDSIVVRDMGAPTAIGIDVSGACPGGAVLARQDGNGRTVESAAGRGTISLGFPDGSHRYEVRCGSSRTVARRGRVRILRNSGEAAIPRSAPESTVETDGRTYSVLFQNLLPTITARWPDGPAGGTVVVVQSPNGTRRESAGGPRYRFATGSLVEGTHRIHFESPSTGRRSRDTTVNIRFDPAATTLSLQEPRDGSFGPGQSVTVSGIALSGWSVSVGGASIPIGGDQRFSGTATVPGNGVLVVRVARAGQGVQYYLRRARRASP